MNFSKILIFLFIPILILSTFSCNEDIDDPIVDPPPIEMNRISSITLSGNGNGYRYEFEYENDKISSIKEFVKNGGQNYIQESNEVVIRNGSIIELKRYEGEVQELLTDEQVLTYDNNGTLISDVYGNIAQPTLQHDLRYFYNANNNLIRWESYDYDMTLHRSGDIMYSNNLPIVHNSNHCGDNNIDSLFYSADNKLIKVKHYDNLSNGGPESTLIYEDDKLVEYNAQRCGIGSYVFTYNGDNIIEVSAGELENAYSTVIEYTTGAPDDLAKVFFHTPLSVVFNEQFMQ